MKNTTSTGFISPRIEIRSTTTKPTVELKVLRCHEKAQLPAYQTDGAAGMDLCAALDEPCVIEPFERKLVPTGIKVEIPTGFEIQVRPRSGLSIKSGITLVNCVGTIDEDYRGEIRVPVINLSNTSHTINSGDRIAQMILAEVPKARVTEVSELSETKRGEGGFGSTGTK